MGTPRQPLSLVGAPIECGANIVGSALGPSALRTAGLRGTLGELGCEVIDHGDLMPAPRVDLACLHSGEHSRRRME
jgi:arginase